MGDTAEEAIKARIDGLTTWLKEHAPECFEEQKHLDAGSVERVYWHYGYMIAARDIYRLLFEKGAMQ